MSKFKDDPEIKDKMEQLEKIHGQVFDKNNGRIDHLPCKDIPEGLNEDSYILIYKKQQQCIRYHIYQVLQQTGGSTTDVEIQKKQQDQFVDIMKRRPEFQEKAMKLYDVKKNPGDQRKIELIMRETYLDFYSKSLQPDNKTGVAYSKRLQLEQKQHNSELEKMLKYNEKLPHFQTDPLLSKDEGISKEQKELLGYKMTDGTFIESEDKDESKSGITKNLMDKLKQNKEDGDEKLEEKQNKPNPTCDEFTKA